jgi:Flp pilus assembly pilin Flp
MRARLRDERGVAAVEFAIVSLLLLTILYGMITFGFVFALDHNLTSAAAEGARSAISEARVQPATPAGDLAVEQFAVDAARDRLAFAAARANAVIQADKRPCDNDQGIQCITVTIDYDYDTYPLVPGYMGFDEWIGELHNEATVQLD